jgi:hypothetical protein
MTPVMWSSGRAGEPARGRLAAEVTPVTQPQFRHSNALHLLPLRNTVAQKALSSADVPRRKPRRGTPFPAPSGTRKALTVPYAPGTDGDRSSPPRRIRSTTSSRSGAPRSSGSSDGRCGTRGITVASSSRLLVLVQSRWVGRGTPSGRTRLVAVGSESWSRLGRDGRCRVGQTAHCLGSTGRTSGKSERLSVASESTL